MKEYQFGDYKAIDTGCHIKLFKKTLDEFSTFYYKPISNYQYKEDPTEAKNPNMAIFNTISSTHEEIALMFKTLLEENKDLKFYNKMEEALK